jgi:hypothetical protein
VTVARRGSTEAARTLPDAAGRLLALPPDRFTAERELLAKRLMERGDPAAAAVRKLRRPVGLAWLLNLLARERGREVGALLDAGDRVRAAQRRAITGGGGEGLRGADEALRGAARELRGAAGELAAAAERAPSAAALARLELLLRMIAVAPGDARDALRSGTLAREPEVADGDLSGLALVAPAAGSAVPPRRSAGTGERARRTARGGGAERKRADTARERREAELRARRAEAARARTERAERVREERAARERTRRRAAAERAIAAAERKAEAARRRAEAAEREVEAARAALLALEGKPPEVGRRS